MDSGIDPDRRLELLDRHRPVLRFDPQYDYRVLAAESAIANPGNLLRRADGEVIARSRDDAAVGIETLTSYPSGVEAQKDDYLAMAPDYIGDARRMEWEEPYRGRLYGRAKEDGGRTWLQYWFWLYYNPKSLLGIGKHEGDWEMIQVGLGPDDKPQLATYAQHDSGEARPWRKGGMEFSPNDPQRPVVYVAPLSHASYFEPNSHPYFLGVDHPYEGGPAAAELAVSEFGPWVNWEGRWGSTERRILGKIGGGPRSPRWQNPKWDQPGSWHRRMRYRRVRAWLGKAMRQAGRLTFPSPPQITEAGIEEGRVRVRWELEGRGARRRRHLQITLHERHFVIASRVVENAAQIGTATLPVPERRQPTRIMVSAYNRLRQRSDLVEVSLAVMAEAHAESPRAE